LATTVGMPRSSA